MTESKKASKKPRHLVSVLLLSVHVWNGETWRNDISSLGYFKQVCDFKKKEKQ